MDLEDLEDIDSGLICDDCENKTFTLIPVLKSIKVKDEAIHWESKFVCRKCGSDKNHFNVVQIKGVITI